MLAKLTPAQKAYRTGCNLSKNLYQIQAQSRRRAVAPNPDRASAPQALALRIDLVSERAGLHRTGADPQRAPSSPARHSRNFSASAGWRRRDDQRREQAGAHEPPHDLELREGFASRLINIGDARNL
jgi:hypothetical protein